jgi:hypothetical protein
MADAADAVSARRAALLLRCQRRREQRRRIDVVRAVRACCSAETAEVEASQRRDAHHGLLASGLAQAHDAVRGRVVDLEALSSLAALEQDLQKQVAVAEAALGDARENRAKAELALTEATLVLRAEVKAMHRRQRLADQMLAASSRATETAAETEREDQTADNWNAR